jgi:hypothetical protein
VRHVADPVEQVLRLAGRSLTDVACIARRSQLSTSNNSPVRSALAWSLSNHGPVASESSAPLSRPRTCSGTSPDIVPGSAPEPHGQLHARLGRWFGRHRVSVDDQTGADPLVPLRADDVNPGFDDLGGLFRGKQVGLAGVPTHGRSSLSLAVPTDRHPQQSPPALARSVRSLRSPLSGHDDELPPRIRPGIRSRHQREPLRHGPATVVARGGLVHGSPCRFEPNMLAKAWPRFCVRSRFRSGRYLTPSIHKDTEHPQRLPAPVL